MKEQKCMVQQATKKTVHLAAFALSPAEMNTLKGGVDYIVDEEGNFIVEEDLGGS